MKIVVDTNIVFSAILNSSSKISQLIICGNPFFEFYSIHLLKEEIQIHREKLIQISGLSSHQVTTSLNYILSHIKFLT